MKNLKVDDTCKIDSKSGKKIGIGYDNGFPINYDEKTIKRRNIDLKKMEDLLYEKFNITIMCNDRFYMISPIKHFPERTNEDIDYRTEIIEFIASEFRIYPETPFYYPKNYDCCKGNDERKGTIESLLKIAFGKTTRGTRIEKLIVLDVDDRYTESENSKLAGITKKALFGLGGEYPFGNFLSQDGGVLELKVSWGIKRQAKEYARLYEEMFDEKPVIDFISE